MSEREDWIKGAAECNWIKPAAPVEEDDETIARRLAIIFHGDDVEWKGFLTKAHHWMSLSIDAADKRAQAHECSSAATDADLVQRCRELLDWSKTGLLNGGKGGALRAYADRLKEKIGEHYALNVAESNTKNEAMRELVRLATEPQSVLWCCHARGPDDVLATEAAARIEALEAALREIKQLALNCQPAETPAALAHMVRICIDAGITRAALAPEPEK